jgi:PKD repeat protein
MVVCVKYNSFVFNYSFKQPMRTTIFPFVLMAGMLVFTESCKKKESSEPAPVADFTFTGDSVMAPAAVVFTNASKNATEYLWEFGDNITSTDKDPGYTYAAGGNYTVKLTAKGPGGSNTVSKNLFILDAPKSCVIKNVSVTQMPFADGNGAGWDLFDGPDVCYKITNANGDVLVDGTSARFDNTAAGNLPRSWTVNPAHNISPLNTARNIQILDYDLLDPSDVIGSVAFNPNNYLGQYPGTITLTGKDITVVLTVQWQ